MDLFGTTGQQRRNWLDGIGQRIGEGLHHFLGPSGLDQRANALAAVGPMGIDGADYEDAVTGSRNLFADPSLANALAFATPMVALAMPGVSARMAERAAGFSGDLARLAGDEMFASRREKGMICRQVRRSDMEDRLGLMELAAEHLPKLTSKDGRLWRNMSSDERWTEFLSNPSLKRRLSKLFAMEREAALREFSAQHPEELVR